MQNKLGKVEQNKNNNHNVNHVSEIEDLDKELASA